MSTASNSLAGLPAELLLRITESLPLRDRCTLSSANSQFREFMIPAMFRTIRASNKDDRAEEIQGFAEKIGRHVETLIFECHLRPNGDGVDHDHDSASALDEGFHTGTDDEDENAFTPEGLPQQLQDLLRGQSLPNLQTLKVSFVALDNYNAEDGWEEEGYGLGTIYIHQEHEDVDTVVEKEAAYSWRLVLNQVFECMAANETIKELGVIDLPPKACSVFQSEAWQRFLGRLDTVSLDLWGGDNGAGWHSNTLEGYGDFVRDLSGNFCDHLSAVKRLRFVADAENPVGCEGMNHTPVPFEPAAMPKIEHLELWNCFVDPPLVDFLQTKSQQLKSLRLINCFSASESGLAENPISWANFFTDLRKSGPMLLELSVLNSSIPLTGDEEFDREPKESEPDDVVAIRETLKSDSKRRLFAYVALDDKYGMVFRNEEQNVERFEQGDDQREHDALMGVVVKNREAAGLSATWADMTLEQATAKTKEQHVRHGYE